MLSNLLHRRLIREKRERSLRNVVGMPTSSAKVLSSRPDKLQRNPWFGVQDCWRKEDNSRTLQCLPNFLGACQLICKYQRVAINKTKQSISWVSRFGLQGKPHRLQINKTIPLPCPVHASALDCNPLPVFTPKDPSLHPSLITSETRHKLAFLVFPSSQSTLVLC